MIKSCSEDIPSKEGPSRLTQQGSSENASRDAQNGNLKLVIDHIYDILLHRPYGGKERRMELEAYVAMLLGKTPIKALYEPTQSFCFPDQGEAAE